MDELERAGRAVVANPPAAPTSLEQIEARSAQLRRRRRIVAATSAVGVVALLGGLAAVVAAVGNGDSTRPVDVQPVTPPSAAAPPQTPTTTVPATSVGARCETLDAPPFQAAWLPDGFEGVELIPGSGGSITIGPDGAIEGPEGFPGWWTWLAEPGRFVDVRPGPSPYGRSPNTDDLENIEVLGRAALMTPIEDGYAIELSAGPGECDQYVLLGYGVAPGELMLVAEGLTDDPNGTSPSQSVEDAGRDGVPPALAELPVSLRVRSEIEVESPQGVWVLSRPRGDLGDDRGILESDCAPEDPDCVYGVDFVAPVEYGEVLLMDTSKQQILRAFPMPGLPPTWIHLDDDAVLAGRVGDGGLPDSTLVRIDREDFGFAGWVFPPSSEPGGDIVEALAAGRWRDGWRLSEQADVPESARFVAQSADDIDGIPVLSTIGPTYVDLDAIGQLFAQ